MRRPFLTALALGVAAAPRETLAHAVGAGGPNDLWSAWTFDPLVWTGLGAAVLLYGVGLGRIWRRAGIGRGTPFMRAGSFAGGMLCLFLALVWPLDALGEDLFAAHMAQHMLLIAAAAPLLILGDPLPPFLRALSQSWRNGMMRWSRIGWWRATWKRIGTPMAAALIHGIAVWAWHAPPAFEAALLEPWIHRAEHASFLFTALLFWWALARSGRHPALGYGAGFFAVFAMALHSGLLGALITFAPAVLYPTYEGRTEPWGLTPLADQQLAGLIMWVPGGIVYLIAGLALVAAWLNAVERRVRRRESGSGWSAG